MLIETSDNMDALYLNSLLSLASDGNRVSGVGDSSSPGSSDSFIEESPAVITLTNPRHRVTRARKLDVFNAVGQFLWIISGSTKQEDIEFYNDIAKFFADDDSGELYGPWGERISPQLDSIVSTLQKDPSSRRAIIPVFIPKDVGYSSRNLPCCSSIQFLIRDGRLSCNVTMRSSNALGVLPYDLFMLTMVHEYVASFIPAPLGEFRFIANSFHIYEKDMDRLRDLLDNSKTFNPRMDSYYPMPPMPSNQQSPSEFTEELLNIESSIRKGLIGYKDLDSISIDPYWKDILRIVTARFSKLSSESSYKEKRSLIADEMSYEPLTSLVRNS